MISFTAVARHKKEACRLPEESTDPGRMSHVNAHQRMRTRDGGVSHFPSKGATSRARVLVGIICLVSRRVSGNCQIGILLAGVGRMFHTASWRGTPFREAAAIMPPAAFASPRRASERRCRQCAIGRKLTLTTRRGETAFRPTGRLSNTNMKGLTQ
jgi:hypothetical protein